MYIDRLIKKEIVTIIVLVLIVLMLFFGLSYAYFKATDMGENNKVSIGDLDITFCDYESCKNDYNNYGQIIGTKIVNGKKIIEGIYPYKSDTEALNEDPYVFNIKNTGTLKSYLTIKLNEDKDYINENNLVSLTNNYSDNIRIALNNCDNGINRENVSIMTYSLLKDNVILKDDFLESNEDKTYCLWAYLSNNTPNEAQNTCFVANLDFSVEYKPR